ncbi:hypothetical protein ABPG72_012975 [Tetrahymena utriculariae]
MSFEPSRIVNYKQVEFIIDELKCKVCDCILECPVNCKECQNHFCWKCIREWLETPGSNRKCPSCRAIWKEREGSLLMKTLLRKLNFYCQSKERGCDKILNYDDLAQHEMRTCDYAERSCPFGCKKKIMSKDLQQHKDECLSHEKYELKMRNRQSSGPREKSFSISSNPDFNPFSNLKQLRQLGFSWETHFNMDNCKNGLVEFTGMGWKKLTNFVQGLSGLAPDEQFNRLKGKGDFEQYGILGWTYALEVETLKQKLEKCFLCSKKLNEVVQLFKQRIDYLILFEQEELEEFSDEEVESQADYNYMVLNQMIGSLVTQNSSSKRNQKKLHDDEFLQDNLSIIRETGRFWVDHLINCQNKQVKIDITGWEFLEDFALGLKGTASEKWFLDLTNENDNMICWREILLSEDIEEELSKCKLCIQTRDKIVILFKTRIDRLLSLEHQMPKCDEIIEKY